MADQDIYEGDFAADEALATEDDEQKRSRWPIVVALLLLLLRLCSVLSVVSTYVGRGPEQLRSIVSNLECLQCHSELIPELRASSVHNPFELESCTVCHTLHAQETERTVWAETTTFARRTSVLVRWLPITWLFSLTEARPRSSTALKL